MSNIDKQAHLVSRYDLVSGYMQKWPDGEFVYHSDYQALLDELEAKDRQTEEQANIIARQKRWIKGIEVAMIAATDRAEAAEKRMAVLEASHSNLREAVAGIHNTIAGGGAHTPLAAILNASKRAYEESAAAADKGE